MGLIPLALRAIFLMERGGLGRSFSSRRPRMGPVGSTPTVASFGWKQREIAPAKIFRQSGKTARIRLVVLPHPAVA
ncbi:MAG: hypothetical protein ACLQGP_28415 [Isosphaeraceae bacterium]